MSLINRMLRDLSARQPQSGDVMGGIQLPGSAPAPRPNVLGRLAMLAVLVTVFTAGLWWMFGPRPMKIPQPRAAPAGAEIAEAPTPEPPPLMASAPPDPGAARLQMDTQLATGEAKTTPPAAEPKEPAPRRVEKARKTQAATSAPARTVAPAPAQAAERYAEARRALERGDLAAAEVALVDTLALDPALHAAREDLGTLRIRQGRLDDAESVARAGLELNPSWVGYRRLVARLELAASRPAGAVAVLERDPPPVERDAEYHALLASAYQRLNRHEDASRSYRSLAELQPDRAPWWAGYGLSRDALGDTAGALAAYARARQLGGLDTRVLEHINRRTLALQQAG